MSAAPQAIAATQAITALMRNDRGRLMAALIARLRDFQLAEEALQEAAISAVSHWGRSGVPSSPQGWLLRVALRKAIDKIRVGTRETRKASELARLAVEEVADMKPETISDERLSLIFTCCHPALEQKSQIALTLRTVCGLTTPEIAQAFLDMETTMGQRLSRAKAKIAAARIPFAIPEPHDWGDRLQAVLTVIYLIYNAGYTAGPLADRDLCDEAIYLARILNELRAEEAEVEGCLALMLLSHGRRRARINAAGETVPPQDQDRSLWDMGMLTEGDNLVRQALSRRRPGPNQIKAAIAACHALPGTPDWAQIRLLYETLLRYEPTDVVRLNLAVAMAEAGDTQTGLRVLESISAALADYQPFHAASAALHAKAGAKDSALAAYSRAISLAANPQDTAFLTARRDALLQL